MNVTPTVGWFRSEGDQHGGSPENLGQEPVRNPVMLNRSIVFEQPGHYEITVTTSRLVPSRTGVPAPEALAQQTDHLDALLNNAGLPGFRSTPLEESIEDIKAIYEVNVFGPMRVTQAFQGFLKAAPSACVVNISSGLGSLTRMSDPASEFGMLNFLGYNSSKTALNGATVILANAFRPFGIKVNSADPGYVATDLNDHSGPRTVAEGATPAVLLATLKDDGPTGKFFDEAGLEPW